MNIEQNNLPALRVFFSICLNDETHEAVVKISQRLQQKLGDEHIRWTKADHLHITLKFIGKIKSSKLQKLINIVPTYLHQIKPFDIQLGSVYAFPPNRPHCIAIAIKRSEALAQLAQSLDAACKSQGFEPERRAFLPHLTLARVKSKKFPDLTEFEQHPHPKFEANSVTLFKSEPTEAGSQYTALTEFKLIA